MDTASGCPQLKQNFAPGTMGVLQLGQRAAGLRPYPQFMQNRAVSGFAVWQFGQIILE
jgi:hypothetical protein